MVKNRIVDILFGVCLLGLVATLGYIVLSGGLREDRCPNVVFVALAVASFTGCFLCANKKD